MDILKFKNGDLGTMAIGAGAVVLAPLAVSALSAVMRPVTKNMIKGGIIAYDTTRSALTRPAQAITTWASEARSEMASSKSAKKK